jgi:hypothetical protein
MAKRSWVHLHPQAPIYAELKGKRAGDAISFNGKKFVIEEVP